MTFPNWGISVMSESNPNEFENRMRNDPRTNEELISTALRYARDDDQYWDLVGILQRRDTPEALSRNTQLCQSSSPVKRCLGADIVGQLGVPKRTFPKECLSILIQMLQAEKDVEVLRAILIALGHLGEDEAIEPAVRFHRHPDPRVRHGVVFALTGHEDQRAIETLVELSQDEDAEVRDWATFGLGTQINVDTPKLREALFKRLNDVDVVTRCEAIVGLARRGDHRMVPALSKELAAEQVDYLAVEAAEIVAAPELYPYLNALQGRWDGDKELLARAVATCSCPHPDNEPPGS